MRDIIFRGKCLNNAKWVEGWLVRPIGGDHMLIVCDNRTENRYLETRIHRFISECCVITQNSIAIVQSESISQ